MQTIVNEVSPVKPDMRWYLTIHFIYSYVVFYFPCNTVVRT
jgi:hypothetical protein